MFCHTAVTLCSFFLSNFGIEFSLIRSDMFQGWIFSEFTVCSKFVLRLSSTFLFCCMQFKMIFQFPHIGWKKKTFTRNTFTGLNCLPRATLRVQKHTALYAEKKSYQSDSALNSLVSVPVDISIFLLISDFIHYGAIRNLL